MILLAFLSLFYLAPFQAYSDWNQPHQMASGDSLTVYVFLEDECLISQFYTPELTRLFNKYNTQHVGFLGYFPNFSSDTNSIDAFAIQFKLEFPLQSDYQKDWTRKFGVTVTPEVVVMDHRTDQLIYRGRIDDSYVRVGKRKLNPQHHDLEESIDAWISHQNAETIVTTQAIGCFINFGIPATPPSSKGGDK
jgi:peroxiredoxin